MDFRDREVRLEEDANTGDVRDDRTVGRPARP
jgi:hypothetical protein